MSRPCLPEITGSKLQSEAMQSIKDKAVEFSHEFKLVCHFQQVIFGFTLWLHNVPNVTTTIGDKWRWTERCIADTDAKSYRKSGQKAGRRDEARLPENEVCTDLTFAEEEIRVCVQNYDTAGALLTSIIGSKVRQSR